MKQEPIRIYADTSVFGGAFDEEFSRPSQQFFRQVLEGRFRLVLSPLVQDELVAAPERVQRFFDEVTGGADIVRITADATRLQTAYLSFGILTDKSSGDALHVAIATVSECSVIVSWNFKHIVHFDKIPLYNAVNRQKGFSEIAIYSPLEVIEYEDEDI